jgi:hypothetical protein
MKDLADIVCCTADYGTFLDLASKMGERVAKSYYYSPFETEYRDARKCIIGTGLPGVERLDEYMDPKIIDEVDLWIFPDIGYGGFQRYLRSIGKAVWGSMGASDLELFRTRFLKKIRELGLPVAPSKVIKGLTALSDHLKTVEDKWIKVNRFRENMETWHHKTYDHSEPILEWLAVEFGGVAENVVFVIQDPILHAQEIGYDGFNIDGQFPDKSFQGYEKKNQLYLGTWLEADDMPGEVKAVNAALSPYFKEIGYRSFVATEIRDDKFIDPTFRMAGQTQEHLLETCTNLPEIIWTGANGEMVQPKFSHKFAAEGTLHYTAGTDHWMVLRVPEEVRPFVKLYGYCQVDGVCHFPPRKNDELGVVIGQGNTVQEAIDHLKENLELLEKEPVSCDTAGFVDLIQQIEEAQAKGNHFTSQKLPEPSAVLT